MEADMLGWFIVIESFFQQKNIKDIFDDREDQEGYYTGILSFLVDVSMGFIKKNCEMVI